MPVNRAILKEPLTKTYIPNWHCPTCAGGYLRHKPDALHQAETSASRKARDHEAWDPDWTEYKFSTLLVCNNEICQEPVVVSGVGKVDLVRTDDYDYDYLESFYANYVNPSPALIALSPIYPHEVILELKKSFVASWGDYSAAGNHVRASVERLLDHLKEPKTKLVKSGKRERLSLHTRILGLAHRDKDLSEALLAAKWLGNAGSHSDDLTQDDVCDALDILESVLDELFVRHKARLKKLVAAINLKKGPAKRSRSEA
jgi:Domain of unknown function (DUF4145)